MKRNSGQSLIEVLLALGVTVIFLVGMISALTRSIANSQFSENKSLANKYTEEGLERARALRDQAQDWTTFRAYTYNEDTTVFPAPSPFVRKVTFTDDGADKKKVTINVSWTDSKGTHETEGITYFTKWE